MDLMSTAQLLGNFGEFFGAIAVVVTLAYLAVQIRQNKDASLASTHRNVSLGLVEVVDALKDPALRGITLKIMDSGFQSLERDEQARMSVWLCTFMWVLEDAYFQWRAGNFPDRAWRPRENHMLDILTMREVDSWLEVRKAWFDPGFITYVRERMAEYRPTALMTHYEPGTAR